ncbi:class II aldolase/adducin family protein [Opitutus terrae]|uniref:Class II aldolase/adducin family protein n=1 Tax=Opitutus terrae (strain DSM 11246 / JCM 15787 / PB90-1) TaxID=452637 RepID=B1ZRA0_OPITP|nr:class II aldolase/adducin family protein [Opitutus terrae]ACB74587.1 class II aldolase/adducin family protein [Opitutus terrae PB90-1]
MDSAWLHPRDELVATMQRIYRYRMTTTSGGNLSIRDPDGSIWITPARVDKGALTPADIVRVLPDDRREGTHPPSSEFPFHREIYRRRPDIKAIVHAHPGALVAFSICRQLPDTRVQSHVHAVCGRVALAPYACPGTQALGDKIAATFAAGADCVLLENHGVVIGGRDLRDAFQRFETLEFAAQTLLRAASLGPVRVLPPETLAIDTMPQFRDLPIAPPSNEEKDLRNQICRFVQRAYQQRLLISTAGAFSARLAQGEFLITPRRRDRLELQPPRIVRVRGDACPAGQQPSRAARLHAEIYARHPEIGAIINAQPAHASAFCVTDVPLSTHTIPESYVVLNDVPELPFRRIVEDAAVLATEVSATKRPVVLIANEGALVVGRTLLEAFDRLEVLEATAEALLLARPLGGIVEMPDSAINELREAFKIP